MEIQIRLIALFQRCQHFLDPLGRIENGRLVHVVPEALNALIDQGLVVSAEPLARLGLEKVRKVHQARPDCPHKVISLGIFTEITSRLTRLIDRITGLNFDAGINNGYQVDMLFGQFLSQAPQIREARGIHGEIPVVLHIVDIEINTVQRDAVFPMASGHRTDICFGGIAPPALAIAESPLGRDVTAANEGAESADNLPVG